MVVIPKLRVKVRLLGRQRQLTARALAGRIAEAVDGTIEIHTNDTSNFERADIVDRLGKIFLIRFELYQRKFFVKYLNNMLAATTPFLFYLIGGYLALHGKFDTGSLLAAIVAYKELPDPIKQLIDWDQQRQDVQIKYDQVMEQFSPDGMLPAELQSLDADTNFDHAAITPQPRGAGRRFRLADAGGRDARRAGGRAYCNHRPRRQRQGISRHAARPPGAADRRPASLRRS